MQHRTHVIERSAPLDAASADWWAEWLVYLASVAGKQQLSDEDRELWTKLASAPGARSFVTRPDFYGCEMQVVTYGYRPEVTS
jgi:hypothetical protein